MTRRRGKATFVSPVSLQKRTAKRLETTAVGVWIDFVSSVFSVIGIALYIVETYGVLDNFKLIAFSIELIIVVFFTFEYVLRWYVSEMRWTYVVSLASAVDLLTIVPVFMEMAGDQLQINLAFVRVVRIMRLLRLLRVHRMVSYSDNDIQRQVFVFVFTFISIIFITAGLLQTVEDYYIPFHDAIYLTVITISTVGYGDLSPQTDLARIVVMVMMAVTFTAIPYQTNSFMNLLALTNRFSRACFKPRGQRTHVLVCGHLSMKSVEGFLYEFFHMDHGFSNTDVCFLSHVKPDSSLEQLLLGSRFPKRVEYLQGTPRSERDLARAAASSAKAIFVLANKKTESVLEEDANNIMLVLSLRQYLLRCGASGKLNMFVEVLDSKSKTHLDQSLNAGLEPVVYLARNQQARFSLSCDGDDASHKAAIEALRRQEAQLNSLRDMQAGKRIICIHEMKMSLLGVNA